MNKYHLSLTTIILLAIIFLANSAFCQDDDSAKNVLKQGLLGAGTGAIAAGASGGKAGEGALIGAGTGVIGSMLLDALTTPSKPARRQARQQEEYVDDQGDEYYEEPAQESGTQKVLKNGLVGAGTGAIAAGVSGGNAGKGALIGAGTGAIGSALLDTLTTPSQPKRVYRRRAPRQSTVQPVSNQQNIQVQEETTGVEGGKKKVVKKYDASGKLISEEETYY